MMAAEPPSVSRLRTQDHRAFGALVDGQYEPVRRYITRLVGDVEVAAELAQETFLRAYQALPGLADDSNVGAWLFRIATNLSRQHLRRRRLICWSRLEAHHAPSRSLEDDVARRDRVRRALARLPLDQRMCLLLYAWTGYTCAEIGGITGKSTAAVRMCLVRARRRFRAAYDACGDLGDLGHLGDGSDLIGGAGRTGDVAPAGGAAPPRSSAHSGGAGGAGVADTMEEDRSDCQAVEEALPFYPRGDLPRDTFSAVTRHLVDCLRCRNALTRVQATYRLLQRHLNLADGGYAPAARVTILARLGAPATAGAASSGPLSLEPTQAIETAAAAVVAPVPVPVLVPVRRPRREPPWSPPTS